MDRSRLSKIWFLSMEPMRLENHHTMSDRIPDDDDAENAVALMGLKKKGRNHRE